MALFFGVVRAPRARAFCSDFVFFMGVPAQTCRRFDRQQSSQVLTGSESYKREERIKGANGLCAENGSTKKQWNILDDFSI